MCGTNPYCGCTTILCHLLRWCFLSKYGDMQANSMHCSSKTQSQAEEIRDNRRYTEMYTNVRDILKWYHSFNIAANDIKQSENFQKKYWRLLHIGGYELNLAYFSFRPNIISLLLQVQRPMLLSQKASTDFEYLQYLSAAIRNDSFWWGEGKH